MPTFDDPHVREMLLGRRAVRAYPMPGAPDLKVGIRALPDREIDLARIEAQRYAKKLGAELDLDPEFLDREIMRQILARACVDPDARQGTEPAAFFATTDDVRALDSVTIAALFRLYQEHQDHVSPLRRLSEKEVAEFVEALKKAPDAGRALSGFEHASLVSLCISMASALRSS